jgi:hypothetical protein
MFRLMPPLHHDADPNRSQVVAHIMENMQCDIGRAIAAFASMRNPKSRVLVYDHIHRMWKGCDWQPSDEDSAKGMVLSELRALQRRVAAMDSELRKATREIKRLSKQLANLKESVVDDDDEDDETEEEYLERRKMENDELNRDEENKERIEAAQKAACKGLKKRDDPSSQLAANIAAAWS